MKVFRYIYIYMYILYIHTTFGGRRVPDAIIHPDFMFSDKHCRKFTRHLKTGKVCVHRRHPFLKGAIAVTPPKTNNIPSKIYSNRCKDDFPFSGWSYFQGFFHPSFLVRFQPRGGKRFRSFRKLGYPDPTIKGKVTLVYHDKSGTGVGVGWDMLGKICLKREVSKQNPPWQMSWGSRKQPVLRPQNGVSTERGQDSWGDVLFFAELVCFWLVS